MIRENLAGQLLPSTRDLWSYKWTDIFGQTVGRRLLVIQPDGYFWSYSQTEAFGHTVGRRLLVLQSDGGAIVGDQINV